MRIGDLLPIVWLSLVVFFAATNFYFRVWRIPRWLPPVVGALLLLSLSSSSAYASCSPDIGYMDTIGAENTVTSSSNALCSPNGTYASMSTPGAFLFLVNAGGFLPAGTPGYVTAWYSGVCSFSPYDTEGAFVWTETIDSGVDGSPVTFPVSHSDNVAGVWFDEDDNCSIDAAWLGEDVPPTPTPGPTDTPAPTSTPGPTDTPIPTDVPTDVPTSVFMVTPGVSGEQMAAYISVWSGLDEIWALFLSFALLFFLVVVPFAVIFGRRRI